MWLAMRAELEPERQHLEQAMAVSLIEAESVKPEVPLTEKQTAELVQHFIKSALLAQVKLPLPILFMVQVLGAIQLAQHLL